MTRATTSKPGSAATSPVRDRWRTIRTITCELQALTGPTPPPGFGRPLAGPELVVELPRFEGHMLRGPVLPVGRPLESRAEPPRILAPAAPARPSLYAWVGPLMLFAITGMLIGSMIALASS